MATRQSRRSPGVYTRWLPNWSWKLDTPKRVPAGARISAGKFGSVEMSLPAHAASVVNCSPVTCIPSPESPANRITARVRVRRGFDAVPVAATLSLIFGVLSVQTHALSYGILQAEWLRSPWLLESAIRGVTLPSHATQTSE